MVLRYGKSKLGKASGGIAGALLASTLYLGTTANADSTPQTTTVQAATTTDKDTATTSNDGSLVITTAKNTADTSTASDATTSPTSASSASSPSADTSATTAGSQQATQATDATTNDSENTTSTDSQTDQAESDAENTDNLDSSLTISTTHTVNVADLINDLAATQSNTDTATGTQNQNSQISVSLQYYDIINDKIVSEKDLEGAYGTSISLDFPIPEGYVLAVPADQSSNGLYMPSNWTFQSTDTSVTYTVPVYRQEDLTRTITRTINVHKPTGTETITQPVVYVSKITSKFNDMISILPPADVLMVMPSNFNLPLQTKTKTFLVYYAVEGTSANLNTYDVTVSAAQPDGTAEWAEYIAPEIEGYTVSQAVVSKVAVAPTDSDVTVDIYYTPEKTEPETPTEPQPEAPKVDEPKPEEPKEEQPVKVETPTSPEASTPEVAEQPAVIESNAEPAVMPTVNTEPVQSVQPVAVNITNAEPAQLPQTGNEQNHTTGLIGAVSAMASSMLAFAGSKKKRRN